MSLRINFENASIVTDPPVVLVSEQMEVYEDTDAGQLIKRIETYEMNGSGRTVSRLMALDTTVCLLDAQRGSTFHQLPEWIRRKAVRNIQNKDNMCFKWSVLAALYKPTDPESTCRYSV